MSIVLRTHGAKTCILYIFASKHYMFYNDINLHVFIKFSIKLIIFDKILENSN